MLKESLLKDRPRVGLLVGLSKYGQKQMEAVLVILPHPEEYKCFCFDLAGE